MKREDIVDAMEFLDDELLVEADRAWNNEKSEKDEIANSDKVISVYRKNASVRRWGSLAAGFAVLIAAAFVFTRITGIRSENKEAVQNLAPAVKEEVQDTAELYEMMTTATADAESGADADAGEDAAESEADAEKYVAVGMMNNDAMEAASEAMEDDDAARINSVESIDEMAGKEVSDEEGSSAARESASDKNGDSAATENAPVEEEDSAAAQETIQIRVTSDAGEIVFVLNDSPAAESLAAQLPLRVETEPYSDNEIVFHPTEPLDTENGIEGGGTAGYLGYYAPWNNVVMYYGDFEAYPGLYILGEAVSGSERIGDITGRIQIEKL